MAAVVDQVADVDQRQARTGRDRGQRQHRSLDTEPSRTLCRCGMDPVYGFVMSDRSTEMTSPRPTRRPSSMGEDLALIDDSSVSGGPERLSCANRARG